MKVVLRYSGGRFVSQGAAASAPIYLPKSNREEVWARVDELLPSLLPGEAVLLETYCPPLKPGARVETHSLEEHTGEGFSGWNRLG